MENVSRPEKEEAKVLVEETDNNLIQIEVEETVFQGPVKLKCGYSGNKKGGTHN